MPTEDIEPAEPNLTGNFVDVDRLENADGIVAIISQRRRDGSLTFGIVREWMSDGAKKRGSFIPDRLHGSYASMVQLVGERIKELKLGKLPFPVRAA